MAEKAPSALSPGCAAASEEESKVDNYTLHKIGMAQQNEIARVIEDAFSAEPWCDDWRDRQQFSLYIADLVDNSNSLALGLYKENQLVAVALGRIVHWFEGTQYCIDDLGVSPSEQGKGIGSLMLRQIEKYAALNVICTVSLKTSRRAPAYGFYKKNGFTEKTDSVYFEKSCDIAE